MVQSKMLHCFAEIRAHWVETKPFEIDNLDIITILLDNAAFVFTWWEDFLKIS